MYTHISLHICLHTHVSTHMSPHTCLYTHVSAHITQTSAHMSKRMSSCDWIIVYRDYSTVRPGIRKRDTGASGVNDMATESATAMHRTLRRGDFPWMLWRLLQALSSPQSFLSDGGQPSRLPKTRNSTHHTNIDSPLTRRIPAHPTPLDSRCLKPSSQHIG